MALVLNQIQGILKSPKNKKTINAAIAHEKRLQFHIETEVNVSGNSQHMANNFIDWVKNILPKSKFHTFLGLLRFPISSNELTEQIFHALGKVFDGRNPIYDSEFISNESKSDWKTYKEEVSSREKWNTIGFEKMKTHINSIMIVDLPIEQSGEKPAPYFYWKNIESIHDIGHNKDGVISYVLFIIEKSLYVIDDGSYRIFTLNDRGEISVAPLVESLHELGYCPARFFWTDFLKSDNKSIKKSPISNQLTNLDKLIFSIISKEHLDLYASYPIYWGYEVDCNYKHPQNGDHCDGGFIKSNEDKYIINSGGTIERCPLCHDKRLAGIGTFVEVPMPDKEEGIPDIKTPVGLVTVDKGALDYNSNQVDKKKAEIYNNVVGVGGENPNQAVNKEQVVASFERPKAVLMSLKRNFELAESWADSTIARLRYGDLFVSNTVNYGTEFHFHTPVELAEMYQKAKEAGLSDTELDNIQILRLESINRNNPQALKRGLLLLQLEPFRHMSKSELIDKSKDKELFNNVDVAVKINFSNFIARFERENMPITEFGINTTLENRVNTITKTLKSYVEQK